MIGFELILPFLRPIQPLVLDPEISETMVNGPEHVFIERRGYVEQVQDVSLSPKSLDVEVKNIARRLAIGFWFALVPAVGFVLLIRRRAQLEDEFLKRNLPGYNDYAKRVPSHLLPDPTVGRITPKGWVCCRVGGRCAE